MHEVEVLLMLTLALAVGVLTAFETVNLFVLIVLAHSLRKLIKDTEITGQELGRLEQAVDKLYHAIY